MKTPFLLVQTPRAGRWNHRYVAAPDTGIDAAWAGRLVEDARSRSGDSGAAVVGPDYLAVLEHGVAQQSGNRRGTEILLLAGVDTRQVDTEAVLNEMRQRMRELRRVVLEASERGGDLVLTHPELGDWLREGFRVPKAPITTGRMSEVKKRTVVGWLAGLVTLVVGVLLGVILINLLRGGPNPVAGEPPRPPATDKDKIQVRDVAGLYGYSGESERALFDQQLNKAVMGRAGAEQQLLKLWGGAERSSRSRPYLLHEKSDGQRITDGDLDHLGLAQEMPLAEFRDTSARLRAVRSALRDIRTIARDPKYQEVFSQNLSADPQPVGWLARLSASMGLRRYLPLRAWVKEVGGLDPLPDEPFDSGPRPPFLTEADRETVKALKRAFEREAGVALAKALKLDAQDAGRQWVERLTGEEVFKQLRWQIQESRIALTDQEIVSFDFANAVHDPLVAAAKKLRWLPKAGDGSAERKDTSAAPHPGAIPAMPAGKGKSP